MDRSCRKHHVIHETGMAIHGAVDLRHRRNDARMQERSIDRERGR